MNSESLQQHHHDQCAVAQATEINNELMLLYSQRHVWQAFHQLVYTTSDMTAM